DPRDPRTAAARGGGLDPEADGTGPGGRPRHSRVLRRARPDRGRQFPTALQPERPRAAGPDDTRRPGRHRRRRRPDRDRPALAPLVVPRDRTTPRDSLSLDPLSRRDPIANRRAVRRALPRRPSPRVPQPGRYAELD